MNESSIGEVERRFPRDFLADFEPIKCLNGKEHCETLYVRNRTYGDYAVAKCYHKKLDGVSLQEGEILKGLNHRGLPRHLGSYENEEMLCVVREFVKGQPLSELSLPLSPSDTMEIGQKLCRILNHLHSQSSPVIHRDIKPQNIILQEGGNLVLIDFEISRHYKEGEGWDTTIWGTRDFSAPEQFGFKQTDGRSDIYALGMVLKYLSTESVEAEPTNLVLQQVVKKATSFDPAHRYQTADEMELALHGQKKPALRRGYAVAGVIALLAVLLLIFYLPKSSTEPNITPTPNLPESTPTMEPEPMETIEAVTFQEPILEEAVRISLGFSESRPITQSDLALVKGVYVVEHTVCGSIYDAYEAVSQVYGRNDGLHNGYLTDISDLAMLPNLEECLLMFQNISDLSPLEELSYLKQVDLRLNHVVDLSPLAGKEALHSVFLVHNDVADIAPLATCPNLTYLDLDGAGFYEGACLTDFSPTLQQLNLCGTIDGFQYLAGRQLTMLNVSFSAMDSLSYLEGVEGLVDLSIAGTQVTSLEVIEVHQGLETLNISQLSIADFSPLLTLPSLTTLLVDSGQETLLLDQKSYSHVSLVIV